MTRTGVAVLYAALGLTLPGAAAHAQGGPALTFPERIFELSQAELDASLPARYACRDLVSIINREGQRWDRLAGSELTLGAFRRLHVDEAQPQWDAAVGRCSAALMELAQGSWSRRVLGEELRLLKEVWRTLDLACRDRVDRSRSVAQVNERVAAYVRALQAWEQQLELNRGFWAGEQLPSRDRPRSCLEGVRARARTELSNPVTAQIVLPAGERDAAALSTLAELRASLAAAVHACEATSDLQRVELRLADESLRCTARAIDALQASIQGRGTDDALREALRCEADVARRLATCRAEDEAGRPPSDGCRPEDPSP